MSAEFGCRITRFLACATLVAASACGGGGGDSDSDKDECSGGCTCEDFSGRWRLTLTPIGTTCPDEQETETDTLTVSQSGCSATAQGTETAYTCSARDRSITCTATRGQTSITITGTLGDGVITGQANWTWKPGTPLAGTACSGSTEVQAVLIDTPLFTWTNDALPFTTGNESIVANDGGARVVYESDMQLYYAAQSQAWSGTSITGYTGAFAFALSPSGVPNVAYSNFDGLYLATLSGSSWTSDEIATDYGYSVGLAIDADGAAHVVLHTYTPAFTYFTNRGGSWSPTPITTTPPDSVSDLKIVLDSAGKAHVVYGASGKIVYATNSSGTWQSTEVATTGMEPDIAIDSDGHVNIVYGGGPLKHATNASGTFVSTELGDYCSNHTLASGPAGHLQLACIGSEYTDDQWNYVLYHGTFSHGAWDFVALTSLPSGGSTSTSDLDLAVDAQGNPHIVWGLYGAPARYLTGTLAR